MRPASRRCTLAELLVERHERPAAAAGRRRRSRHRGHVVEDAEERERRDRQQHVREREAGQLEPARRPAANDSPSNGEVAGTVVLMADAPNRMGGSPNPRASGGCGQWAQAHFRSGFQHHVGAGRASHEAGSHVKSLQRRAHTMSSNSPPPSEWRAGARPTRGARSASGSRSSSPPSRCMMTVPTQQATDEDFRVGESGRAASHDRRRRAGRSPTESVLITAAKGSLDAAKAETAADAGHQSGDRRQGRLRRGADRSGRRTRDACSCRSRWPATSTTPPTTSEALHGRDRRGRRRPTRLSTSSRPATRRSTPASTTRSARTWPRPSG